MPARTINPPTILQTMEINVIPIFALEWVVGFGFSDGVLVGGGGTKHELIVMGDCFEDGDVPEEVRDLFVWSVVAGVVGDVEVDVEGSVVVVIVETSVGEVVVGVVVEVVVVVVVKDVVEAVEAVSEAVVAIVDKPVVEPVVTVLKVVVSGPTVNPQPDVAVITEQ
jgi:hypothetical protein